MGAELTLGIVGTVSGVGSLAWNVVESTRAGRRPIVELLGGWVYGSIWETVPLTSWHDRSAVPKAAQPVAC